MNPRKVVKTVIPKSLFSKVSPYGHWAEAVIAQTKAGFPAKNLKVIGVTGTDGKSTTCALIASMLRSSGRKVGLMTTVSVDYADGKGEQANPTNLTTGNAFQVASIIRKIKDNGAEWLVIEVSSHALHQRRVWGIPFEMAVLTNMSPEHLDYHGTFENYRKAKEMLFTQCNRNKKGSRTGIINADDEVAELFARDIQNPLMYGVEAGTLKAENIKSTLHGNTFTTRHEGINYEIKTNLIGDFNVYNALAAVGVGVTAGLSKEQIEQGIASLEYVPGRMMPINEGQKFKVFIDYAVTPSALEHVLATLKSLTKGNVHVVFGATGDRDTTKRPAMGEVTARLADYVYLTDDETYTENPQTIRDAVYSGVNEKHKNKVQVIEDRKKAIQAAFVAAKAGDSVVITGIGHQTTRNMGGRKQKWSDIEVAKELLR